MPPNRAGRVEVNSYHHASSGAHEGEDRGKWAGRPERERVEVLLRTSTEANDLRDQARRSCCRQHLRQKPGQPPGETALNYLHSPEEACRCHKRPLGNQPGSRPVTPWSDLSPEQPYVRSYVAPKGLASCTAVSSVAERAWPRPALPFDLLQGGCGNVPRSRANRSLTAVKSDKSIFGPRVSRAARERLVTIRFAMASSSDTILRRPYSALASDILISASVPQCIECALRRRYANISASGCLATVRTTPAPCLCPLTDMPHPPR